MESGSAVASYLLISNWVVHRHQGRLWTTPLWSKDLELHLRYIRRLALACPVVDGPPPAEFAVLEPDTHSRITLVDMPRFDSAKDRLLNGLPFLSRLGKAAKQAEILHFTAAGHPILFGWIVPRLRRRGNIGLVACVESSFWRKPGARGLRKWISLLAERAVKSAVSSSHVSFLTQQTYLSELTDPTNSNHVVHAVWIDESTILGEGDVRSRLESRPKDGAIRLAFFGRLCEDKGPDLLVDAGKLASEHGLELEIDIFGEGPSLESLKRIATGSKCPIRFRGFVQYGPAFFDEMRSFDALVVPTRSDEQPRIVYDAYSQGVPVIASATAGLETVVKPGATGLLFSRGDALDLSRAIGEFAADRELRYRASLGALAASKGASHASMHRHRAQVLAQAFPDSRVLTAFE